MMPDKHIPMFFKAAIVGFLAAVALEAFGIPGEIQGWIMLSAAVPIAFLLVDAEGR